MRVRFSSRAAPLLAALSLVLLLAPRAEAQRHWAVRTEPGTPVVALQVLVAAGAADEDSAQAGLAYLSARSVVAPIRPVLDSLRAHLSVDARKDALAFTLIAAPEAWEEASRILLVALFRDPPDSVATVRERRAILAELAAREANPADELVRRTDLAIFGRGHPWARAAVGGSRTVGRLTVQDVDRFLRGNVIPARAVASVVGPVESAQVAQHLGTFFPPGPITAPAPPQPAPARFPVTEDYNSVTTWISVVYPFRTTADVEALRMLGDAVASSLSFGPSRRSIYDVRARVVERRGGGELRFELVVPPTETEQWAEQIRATVEGFSERGRGEELYQRYLRHYRGKRLRELDSPEARAGEIAGALLRSGSAPGTLAEVDKLSAERVISAVRSLPEPVVVFLGPS
jgi:predicted Zn-dependent peptidase